MPKRKLAQDAVEDESDLSPPPEDLLDVAPAANGSIKKSASKTRKAAKTETFVAEEAIVQETPKKRSRKQKFRVAIKEEEEEAGEGEPVAAEPKKKRQRKTVVKEEEEQEIGENGETKVKTKRKSKAQQEAELVEMPLAARTAGHKLYIGAHVSAAGGVHKSVLNAVHIGSNAFALFLKSQRKWANPPLQDDHCDTFHSHCKQHVYDQSNHVVPHGSYLVNLAHTDPERTKQAYDSFVDDLKRCEKLGIQLYNFHPGNDQCNDRPRAIAHLASNINRAHAETKTVVTLLENMAAGGNVLGSTFEDLRDIIALVSEKSRVGVCLDTCHAFAGGYDLRTPQAFDETMQHFDSTVGLSYLRAVHLNDSKAPFASHRDLHANIGTGFLGLRAFHALVNDARFAGLPLVLETPIEVRDEQGEVVKDEKGKDAKEDKGIWAREIKMLEGMVGMDVEGDEFREMEERLARQGAKERERLQEQVGRKIERDGKAKAKARGKGRGGKKAKKEESSGSEGSEVDEG